MGANRLAAIATSIAFIVSVSGCSNKKAAPDLTPEQPAPTAAAPPEDLSLIVNVTPAKHPAPPPVAPDPCVALKGRLQGSMIHFDFDRASINSSAVTEVDQVSAAIRASGLGDAGMFTIEGHCDATGSDGYNIALSERRAQSVLERLVTLGAITLDRSRTVPWGKQQPLDPANTPEAYARNRRVEVVLHCPNP